MLIFINEDYGDILYPLLNTAAIGGFIYLLNKFKIHEKIFILKDKAK